MTGVRTDPAGAGSSTREGFRQRFGPANSRSSYREDLVMALLGAVIVVGGHLDAVAHRRLALDTFFTPWHAIVYSGLLASALWLVVLVRRHGRVPIGYGMGVVGVALFGIGGLADMLWHEVFGIEVNLEAAVSPSHNLLLVAALLLLATPLRVAWLDRSIVAPSLWEFLPSVISITASVVLFALPTIELSPFSEVVGGPGSVGPKELLGFAGMLITTVILLGPALMVLRRWQPPFGIFTLLFGAFACSPIVSGAPHSKALLAGAIGGLVADGLVWATRNWSQTLKLRVFGALVPAVLWTVYFVLVGVFYELQWSLALWSGVMTKCAIAGFGLALLLTLPASPSTRAD